LIEIINDKLTEEEKSALIGKMIDEFKTEYPDLKYHATKQDVVETELRLTKEIENTRKEIKELDVKLTKEIESVRSDLTKEIENTRKEIKELDVKLTKEIESVRSDLTKEIESVRLELTKEIGNTKSSLIKWSFLFWIGQMSALLGIGFFIFKALHLH